MMQDELIRQIKMVFSVRDLLKELVKRLVATLLLSYLFFLQPSPKGNKIKAVI